MVQLTKLTVEGKRALDSEGQKLSKIQYGLLKGAFVKVQESQLSSLVLIAEGVETALSIKEAGACGRIVASLGFITSKITKVLSVKL